MKNHEGSPTTTDLPGRDLITVPEASRLLAMHKDTAYRMARNGTFPGGAAVLLGTRRWRVSVPKLERYLHGEQKAS
jgi:excisionase family DNA binding protein